MTNAGLILTVASGCLAAIGVALLLLSRHSVRTSQGASLALFAHGAFATSGLFFLLTLIHVVSFVPFVIHVHGLAQALSDDFDCDLELDCVAVSSALVAGIVLGASALLGQISSRLLLRQCRRQRVAEGLGGSAGAAAGGLRVWLVRGSVPDAYAIAVLRLDRHRGLRVEDTIAVTTGLRDLLSPAELRATLAHEAAHVRAHDHRYLPFVRTLSTLLFLDPVLRMLSRRLEARYEFGADEDAALTTRDPRSLARALLKMSEESVRSRAATGIRGRGGPPLILRRIERLLDLADRMDAAP